MIEQPGSQKPKEPNAWDKMHPVWRIIIIIIAAFVGEIFMLVLGMLLSVNSSSPAGLIIFASIIPVACIAYALYLIFGPKKDGSLPENSQKTTEQEAENIELTEQPEQELAAEDLQP